MTAKIDIEEVRHALSTRAVLDFYGWSAKRSGDEIESKAKVLIISLRAGAGLDGLQFVARTVVFGELAWSPGVHHQDVGRVHRDGQAEPVMAYYLVADEGSDPVIADVLGIKEAQAQGIVDPERSSEPVHAGASDDHIRRLAEKVIARRGARAKAATMEAESQTCQFPTRMGA